MGIFLGQLFYGQIRFIVLVPAARKVQRQELDAVHGRPLKQGRRVADERLVRVRAAKVGCSIGDD